MNELATIKTYSSPESEFFVEPDVPDCEDFLLLRNILKKEYPQPTNYTCLHRITDQYINKCILSLGLIKSGFSVVIDLDENSTFKDDNKEIRKDFTRKINWNFKRDELIEFVENVNVMNDNGLIDDCLDFINDSFDDKLLSGNYLFCDNIMRSLIIPKIDSSILLGFLTITLPWKPFLPSRSTLFNKIKEEFIERYTEIKIERLLKGLE